MYRNIAYLDKDRVVRLYTWDEDGKRMSVDVPYRPYFYLETKGKVDATSLYNTPLRKVYFNNQYDRYARIKDIKKRLTGSGERPIVRLFENISAPQQFLIDQCWENNDDPEFSKFPLKVQFLDIETYSPEKFPEPSIAEDTVNVITVYDSIDKKYHTWGLKPFKSRSEDQIYTYCESERVLLSNFIDFIKKDPPDVLSGWSSEAFDIPYLINRITNVFGEDAIKDLSPVRTVYSRELISTFGRGSTRWHIKGMSCVDYLDVYKSFSVGLRESYKLNDIAEYEVGEKKVDYGNTNLSSLADDDWDTFVRYNIQDVRLLVKMEDKLQYLELLRMLAYAGLTPIENAMGTINVVTGLAAIESRRKGLVIPTFIDDTKKDAKYEGAYVREPQRGFQDNIVSFDVNSLYPNTIITLNLSPETKIGNINFEGDKIRLNHINGKVHTLSKSNFGKLIKQEKISISKSKTLYTQKRKGIFPEIIDKFYDMRVKVKRELNRYRKQLSELSEDSTQRDRLQDRIDKLNIKQFTIKILMNRVYGFFGNKHSPMSDPDIARSITLTGQSVIKQSNEILTQYIKNKCNLSDEEIDSIDPIIYNDTDSVYVSIKSLIDKLNIPFKTKRGRVTKEARDIVGDIEQCLNDEIKTWGEITLNSQDCRFVFKRESICDVGNFLQKKRYVLHVLDDEGIAVNKFKYTGVEVVRTTMPKAIKPYVKKIIETMLLTKDMAETNKVLNEAYDKFKSLPVEDIAFVMGLSKYKTKKTNDYGDVVDQCDNFHTFKGMPVHAKAAYYYNLLIDKHKLVNRYEAIGAGDKVRYFYVSQPNTYGIKCIGYKYYYPQEFKDILQPDVELMFNKIVYSVIERFYESVGWKCRKPGEITTCDLFDLLK